MKEMLAAILRVEAGTDDAVLSTEGNLNNDIGLLLMLLRLRDTHQFAVLEMGMNHVGEIDYLTRLARPDVALVNNALTAHIGFLGSVENIARAKGEIFNGLSEAGIAVFNADDPHAGLWREANAQRCIIDFGVRQPALVHGHYQPGGFGSVLKLVLPNAEYDECVERLCHILGFEHAEESCCVPIAGLLQFVHLSADSSDGIGAAVGKPKTAASVRKIRVAWRKVVASLDQQGRDPCRIFGIDRPGNTYEAVKVVGPAYHCDS